jgi:hypothetical protein
LTTNQKHNYGREEETVECKGKNKLYLSRFEKREEEEEEKEE